jgi:pimeloyl-ACP methyl ester carboxylesterase
MLEDAVDDVIATADALGVDRFIPVGYSLGGPIAQLLWRRHPDRVAGIVMCATSASFRATPPEYLMHAMLPALDQVARFVPEAITYRIVALVARPLLETCGSAEWVLNELLLHDARAVCKAQPRSASTRPNGGSRRSTFPLRSSCTHETSSSRRVASMPSRPQFRALTSNSSRPTTLLSCVTRRRSFPHWSARFGTSSPCPLPTPV